MIVVCAWFGMKLFGNQSGDDRKPAPSPRWNVGCHGRWALFSRASLAPTERSHFRSWLTRPSACPMHILWLWNPNIWWSHPDLHLSCSMICACLSSCAWPGISRGSWGVRLQVWHTTNWPHVTFQISPLFLAFSWIATMTTSQYIIKYTTLFPGCHCLQFAILLPQKGQFISSKGQHSKVKHSTRHLERWRCAA